ncbi:MAG: hypothetical protein A2172_01725 [Candidatus Woykebacteria bacterium RBG_13_40_15]|uniref:Transposase n=1 Tax=Candidatus Woykebacteria bacterium RBG_13_40_15 TaxID=1802593 RepID=A0A1G1WA56_9BACT|nr:MAG: hypothetical protein A2172_01725 [Candidatus Woykebacteria bacterium RBG_13_40_15]
MPRRKPLLVTNEIYHLFNRGVEKRNIFLSDHDYAHFLETIAHYYRPTNNRLSRPKQNFNKLPEGQLVEILAFCLMPNHTFKPVGVKLGS